MVSYDMRLALINVSPSAPGSKLPLFSYNRGWSGIVINPSP